MDKRKTQRILGILVIIALVIILFPLLFSKNEVSTTASVAAPVFPDKLNNTTVLEQTDTLATTTNSEQTTPASTENSDTKQEVLTPLGAVDTAQNLEENIQPPPNQSEQENNKQPSELNNLSSEQINVTKPIPDEQARTETQQTDSIIPTLKNEKTNSIQSTAVEPKSAIKSTKSKNYNKQISHETSKYNKAAWIVQMGSFKNKENARHLTDKLRTAGFNAFTKEIKSAKGIMRTHVYVGPEFKEASAQKISRKLQHEMNLQSIVLPYNPLAL